MNKRHQDLVDGYCSGSLTDVEFAELEEALRHDHGLRQRLLEYRMLDSDLRSFASTASADTSGGVAGAQQTGRPRRLRFELWAAAAAILILLGAVGVLILKDAGTDGIAPVEAVDNGVAVVTRSVGAEWTGVSLLPYDSVAPGRWELLKGVVELEFYSGASVILEGPASLEILSENGGTLHYGKLRAHVPVQAQGFTIRTREIELVDLGTEFAMEVTRERGTAVHVLDGKVELFAPDGTASSGKELVAGQGQLVDPSGRRSEIVPDPGRFVSREELARRVRELRERTYQRWQVASARLREDPRLVAYYDFETGPEEERDLPNVSLNPHPGLNGAIVGARSKWGRWRGLKRSLDFKHPADRVLIEVPGRANAITLAIWVRLDRFDSHYSVLLHSQVWERPGAVHWRILRRGAMELVVNNGRSSSQKTSSVPCVLQPGDFHRWMSLVVVYDGERGAVSQYRNGVLLGVADLTKVVPIAIGKAEIANRTRSDKGSQKTRHFNGRIGELLIFNKSLSAAEIAELHQNGDKYN